MNDNLFSELTIVVAGLNELSLVYLYLENFIIFEKLKKVDEKDTILEKNYVYLIKKYCFLIYLLMLNVSIHVKKVSPIFLKNMNKIDNKNYNLKEWRVE